MFYEAAHETRDSIRAHSRLRSSLLRVMPCDEWWQEQRAGHRMILKRWVQEQRSDLAQANENELGAAIQSPQQKQRERVENQTALYAGPWKLEIIPEHP